MTASGCRCQSAIFNASSTSVGAQMGRHRPANDAAAPGVHNDREIQEAGPRTDVSDVGYPELIRPVSREISIDQKSSHLPIASTSQVKPMTSEGNIHYEMSGKAEAITCGGIGAFHHLVRRVGLRKEIDRHLHLLEVHLPYHESDHVLNIACNALVGGQRLEYIELRRQDATFLNALGAQRLPDPMCMFGTRGNPQARNLFEIIVCPQERKELHLKVQSVRKAVDFKQKDSSVGERYYKERQAHPKASAKRPRA